MDELFSGVATIPEFFYKRNIFVTGGSGFIGKVLIDKLLRSCPDIGNIYVLLREKKGKSPTERVKELTNIPLFDLLREQNAEAINKIMPLKGDMTKIGLGLCEEDRNAINNTVSVIYHVAATVRFDEPLKKAALENVRGTREIIHLAEDTKNLVVFVHISTVYAHCDKSVIEEKLYPRHVDWREMIQVAERTDDYVLQTLSEKYIKPLPNTYTFSKSLAEHVVNDMCRGKFPTVILRPSIVISTLSEPVPGWIDNFNGPFSLMALAGLGILRIMIGAKSHILDYIAVDNFAKAVAIATWQKTAEQQNKKEVTIYNCCSDVQCEFEEYSRIGMNIKNKVLFDKRIWNPVNYLPITKCWYNYFMQFILIQLIPAVTFDGLLLLCRKKPMLVKIQRKIYIANMVLIYFLTKRVDFKVENYVSLNEKLQDKDKQGFALLKADKDRYSLDFAWGMKKYLFKESATISPKTRRIAKGLKILDYTLKFCWYIFLVYIIYCNRHIILNLLHR